jgi:hypothetical protein
VGRVYACAYVYACACVLTTKHKPNDNPMDAPWVTVITKRVTAPNNSMVAVCVRPVYGVRLMTINEGAWDVVDFRIGTNVLLTYLVTLVRMYARGTCTHVRPT